MTTASPSVYVVVDPVQDYEESLTIYGVYGSLAAAKMATPRLRRSHLQSFQLNERDTEIQHWQGDQRLGAWTYSPADTMLSRTGWTSKAVTR